MTLKAAKVTAKAVEMEAEAEAATVLVAGQAQPLMLLHHKFKIYRLTVEIIPSQIIVFLVEQEKLPSALL